MRNGERRSSEQWIRDLASVGDAHEAALEDLRRVLILGLSRSLSGRRVHDAFIEDVVQDTLLKVVDRLDQFGFRSRFTTWAMTIAARVAATELRRARWRDVSLEEFSTEPPGSADVPTVEQRASHRELVATLLGLVDCSLTERQRTAINAELAGASPEEIARRTGSNRNAIGKLVHDARRKLRKGLEDAGYSTSDLRSVMA